MQVSPVIQDAQCFPHHVQGFPFSPVWTLDMSVHVWKRKREIERERGGDQRKRNASQVMRLHCSYHSQVIFGPFNALLSTPVFTLSSNLKLLFSQPCILGRGWHRQWQHIELASVVEVTICLKITWFEFISLYQTISRCLNPTSDCTNVSWSLALWS